MNPVSARSFIEVGPTFLFFFSVDKVAEYFLELVTDETKNGDALLVSPNVKQYMNFPSFP